MNGRTVPIRLFQKVARAVYFAVTASAAIASATAEDKPFPKFREIKVPADQPQDWPPGNWRAILLKDYLSLLRDAKPAPPGPRKVLIERAEYSATVDLQRSMLRDGSLKAQIRRTGNTTELISLEPLNFAVSQLRWSDGIAVSGTAPNGDTTLIVDRRKGELLGRWSLRGRRLLNHVEFDLRVASATVSQLNLDVPTTCTLTSSAGYVSKPLPAEKSGWQTWQIELGSHTECQFSITQAPLQPSLIPLVLSTQNSTYAIGKSELDISVNLNLEVFDAPLQEFSFWVPKNVTIYSITYGSVDFPLSWKESILGVKKKITVTLPDRLLGRSRPIQIAGITAVEMPLKQNLPQLTLENGTFTDGQLEIQVATPLVLRRFEADGVRQMETSSNEMRQLLTFDQYKSNASIFVDVAFPKSAHSARVLTHVNAEAKTQFLSSEISWQDRSASTFVAKCQISAEWEVIDVRMKSGPVASKSLDWEINRTSNDTQSLVFNFKEPLNLKHSSVVELSARRRSDVPDRRISLPVLQPLECHHVDMLFILSYPAGVTATLEPDSDFDAVQEETLPDSWRNSNVLNKLQRGDNVRLLLAHASRLGDDGTIWLRPSTMTTDIESSDIDNSFHTMETNEQKLVTSSIREDAKLRAIQPRSEMPPSTESPALTSPLASAQLRTLIFSSGSDRDFHHATFILEGHSEHERLAFRLAEPAVLTAAIVNGHAVDVTSRGQLHSVPPLPKGLIRVLEIAYHTPVSGSSVRSLRSVIVPQMPHRILRCEWQIVHPPDLRLATQPDFVHFRRPLSKPTWTTRLFGPLGRPTRETIFSPLDVDSWKKIFEDTTKTAAHMTNGETFAPIGWIIHEATAAELPDGVVLTVWDNAQIRHLAWLGLLSSLMIGALLRIRRVPVRSRVGAWSISLFAAGAWLAPSVCAEVVGGCLIGAVIAAVFPRRLLIRTMAVKADNVSQDSTRSDRKILATFLLVLAVSLATTSQAQERTVPVESVDGKTASPNSDSTFDILIPVTEDQSLSPNLTVVQVSTELLQDLRHRALKRRQEKHPAYLISSAQYHVQVQPQQPVAIRGEFRVIVLSTEPTVQVHFPFENVNFPPDACTVNGKIQPIERAVDGHGFFVELARTNSGQNRRSLSFDVTFVMFTPKKVVPGGASFWLRIPEVSASTLQLAFNQWFPTVEFPHAQGQIEMTGNEPTVAVELGKTDQLQVLWSANTIPVRPPAKLEAQLSTLVEVRHTKLQYQLQVQYDVLAGNVDFLTWNLPPRTIVRQVVVDSQPITFQVLSRHEKNSQLLIEFSKPQENSFAIDALFTVPLDPSRDRIVLPPLDLFGSIPQSEPVNVIRQQVGVVSGLGFRLEPLMKPFTQLVQMNPEDFINNRRDPEGTKKPQLAYQMTTPAKLSFALKPLTPQRQARIVQVGRIRKNRLEWDLHAEILTMGTKVFQHTLIVDPKLQIKSLSVQDEVERLAHVSQIGNRLILYLQGKNIFLKEENAGAQILSLKGSIPLDRSAMTSLPLVRLEGTEFIEPQMSQLHLYHDSNLDVNLQAAEELLPMDGSVELDSDNPKEVLLGRYYLPEKLTRPRIQVSPRKKSTRVYAATVLERNADNRWKLTEILTFQRFDGRPDTIRVALPAPLADAQLRLINATHRTQVVDEGAVQIYVTPKPDVSKFSLVVEKFVDVPKVTEWELPFLSVFDANIHQSEGLLILSPPDVFEPLGSLIVKRDKTEIPDWILQQTVADLTLQDVEAFGNESGHWVLTLDQPQQFPKQANIPLAETRIWINQDQEELGRTDLYVVSANRDALDITWPNRTQLQALFVNECPINADIANSNRLSVPLNPVSAVNRIVIFWSHRRLNNTPRIGSIFTEIPFPKNIAVKRSLLTLVPPEQLLLFIRSDFQRIDQIDRMFKHVEGLLEVNQTLSNLNLIGGKRHDSAWSDLNQSFHSLKRRLAKVLSDDSQQHSARRRRLLQFDREIDTLHQARSILPVPAAVDRTPDVVSRSYDRLESMADSLGLVYAKLPADGVTNRNVSLWAVDVRILTLVIVIPACLLAVFLLRRLMNLECPKWLNRNQAISWMVLGLIWWTCLRLSIFGLALLVTATSLAIWMCLRQFRRLPEQEDIVLEVD